MQKVKIGRPKFDLKIQLIIFLFSAALDDEGKAQVRRETIKLIQHLSSCVVAESAERRLLK